MKNNDKVTHHKHELEHENSQKKHQLEREEIRDAYFVHHWTKSEISRRLHCSRHTVQRWTQDADQACDIDHRGWKKGVRRKHPSTTIECVRSISEYLTTTPEKFLYGATAIDIEWRKRYDFPPPPLRTIANILHDLGLSTPNKRKRAKGASAYLHYPEYTIYTGLGGRVIETDFIGKKSFTGQPDPVHFISYSAKNAPKMKYFQRVNAETASVLIGSATMFFDKFEMPDFLKMDNGPAGHGSGSAKRTVSRTMQFLLQNQVVPIFSVPRKPFTQASIEGSNSVFSRLFWNERFFHSLDDLDHQLEWFNLDYLEYHHYTAPAKRQRLSAFTPRILFIRQVQAMPEQDKEGFINILNENIILPASFIKYFVIGEWNLEKELLTVSFEQDKALEIIYEGSFLINTPSLTI